MVEGLLMLKKALSYSRESHEPLYFVPKLSCLKGLERRGLVKWERNLAGEKNGVDLTEAGTKVCELLKIAGFE